MFFCVDFLLIICSCLKFDHNLSYQFLSSCVIFYRRTFENEEMTIEHVTTSCNTILQMPLSKARQLSTFAKHQGFSCLGTWTHEECLTLGKELQKLDLNCRVVPFNSDQENGGYGWQSRVGDSVPVTSFISSSSPISSSPVLVGESVAYLQELMA